MSIPLHVYLTWKTMVLPPRMKQNYMKLRKKNPEFQFHVFDDTQCRSFLRAYFPYTVEAFDKLIPGAYKADLWRLCVLYQYGGIYMDIKLECLGNFKLYSLVDKEHFVIDRPIHSPHIYNAFMVCKPNNPFLLECIHQLVENVKNNYYGESPLSPTGPEMLGRISCKYSLNVDMCHSLHKDTHIMYKNVAILKNYEEYRKEQITISPIYYYKLWADRRIYV
jgi:mannosyltransferase OCH1-like enzyme